MLNGTYDVDNRGDPNCSFRLRGQLRDGYCIYDENGAVVGGLNAIMGRHVTRGDFDSDYGIDTTSVYLMDTVDLPWGFSTFLGVRADYFDYANTVVSRSGVTTDYTYSDLLWNGYAGLVYAFTDWGNAYFSWSTSSNINGGESDLGGNCGYGGICGTPRQVRDSKPEMSENLELGTKWSLLNDKLLLTAAAFQVTKDDVMENVGDDYETLGTLNTGKNRVRGLEFSVVGNVTDDLSFVVAAAIMESEVRDSVNRANVGKCLSNFANEGVFAQVRYRVPSLPAPSVGAVVTHQSAMFTGQPDSAAGFDASVGKYTYKVPGYTTLDLFANYKVTERIGLRLNVGNVTDENYYLAGYRSGSFVYIGDARNARLALTYSF